MDRSKLNVNGIGWELGGSLGILRSGSPSKVRILESPCDDPRVISDELVKSRSGFRLQLMRLCQICKFFSVPMFKATQTQGVESVVMASSDSNHPLRQRKHYKMDPPSTETTDSLKMANDEENPSSPRSLDEFLQEASERHPATLWQTFRRQYRFWILFLSLGVANSSDAAEILCISYILSEEHFLDHMLHHTSWRAGLLAATVFAGMLLGGLLVGGSWGDKWGRRPTLLAGLALNAGAGLCSAGAWNVGILSLGRFLAGVGIGTTIPPLFTLCTELAPPRERGLCVTIAASFWMVGSLYVALVAWWWLAFVGGSWRIFAALCALPSALGCLLVLWFVPESPRFLLLRGDYRSAVAVVANLSDRLQYAGEPWSEEEAQETAPAMVGSVSSSGLSRLGWKGLVESAWQDFCNSASELYVPSLLSTTVPLQMVWFSLSFGTYGLYTWINTLFFELHLRNVYLNALLFAASNLPGNILSAFLLDRVGLAPLLTGSVLAAALSLMVFAYVAATKGPDDEQHSSSTTHWVVASACAFQMFTIVSWNSIDVLTSELFPTTIRATGMGLCAASGRVGALVAQLINGALVARPAALLLVAAATLLWGAVTPTFLPADATGEPVADTILSAAERNARVQEMPHRGTTYSYQHVEGSEHIGGQS